MTPMIHSHFSPAIWHENKDAASQLGEPAPLAPEEVLCSNMCMHSFMHELIYVCVYVYVCMYVCVDGCNGVCMYSRVDGWVAAYIHARMDIFDYLCVYWFKIWVLGDDGASGS